MALFPSWWSDATSWASSSTNWWWNGTSWRTTNWDTPIYKANEAVLKGLKLARAHLALLLVPTLELVEEPAPHEGHLSRRRVAFRGREHRLRPGCRRRARLAPA